jgi:hypothetical protein
LWTFEQILLPLQEFGLEFVVLSVGRPIEVEVEVEVALRLTASQYDLVSSPLCGRLIRYCFLFKGLGLELTKKLYSTSIGDASTKADK